MWKCWSANSTMPARPSRKFIRCRHDASETHSGRETGKKRGHARIPRRGRQTGQTLVLAHIGAASGYKEGDALNGGAQGVRRAECRGSRSDRGDESVGVSLARRKCLSNAMSVGASAHISQRRPPPRETTTPSSSLQDSASRLHGGAHHGRYDKFFPVVTAGTSTCRAW